MGMTKIIRCGQGFEDTKIQQKIETNPLFVLHQAIHGVTSGIAVKARRVGGSTHQVPIEIGSTQGKALAIRWLLAASRKRPGQNMAFKLSSELVDAAKGSDDAIRKREETHRMTEANEALEHKPKKISEAPLRTNKRTYPLG
ncbi:hypothetical protein E3N88_04643 [Mikania micrantha]|uniref:Small ribosomal subunit protein uS7 domain-containing protein n=1 Tax=Mikania micrantha TaxID=192012 RepID=A0A5N6PV22_9ASTR|nr:hypothetical protein E3N88_04643 [Mikania micrantha]